MPLIGAIIPPAPPSEFYVSADGSDANAGTITSPWQTIAKVNASATDGRPVHFRGGDRFEGALTLLSNTEYDSYGTGRACISGGVEITSWSEFDPVKHIWRASWNAGRPRALWVNGTRVVRARTSAGLPSGTTSSSTGFSTAPSVTPGYMSTWGNQSDIELVYFWEWRNSYAQVDSVVSNTITMNATTFPTLYNLNAYFPTPTLPTYIENAYEILYANATEGTFYQDRASDYVYLIPPAGVSDPNTATVIAPVLDQVALGVDVSDVSISALEFSHTVNLDAFTYGFADHQAATIYTSADLSTSQKTIPAVGVTGASSNVVFDRCVFRYLGTSGLGFSETATDCTASGNILYDISACGIQVGDRNQVSNVWPVRPVLTNNFIAQCGQEFKGGVGILQFWAEDSTIIHNEVYQHPYTGISMGWGWGGETTPNGNANNEVTFNKIHDTSKVMNDGAGVYCNSHNPTALVNSNYVYDIGYPAYPGPGDSNMDGIYLDDGCQGITVSDNVVRTFQDHPFYIHNNISDNVFSTNTASGGTYFVSPHHPLQVAPNTYDTLIVVSDAAAAIAGEALGAGLQSEYADVKTEADSLVP